MSKLCEELGGAYVSERFHSSFIFWNGTLYLFRGMSVDREPLGTRVQCAPLSVSVELAHTQEVIPGLTLETFSDFKWPVAGYCNFKSPVNELMFCSYVSSARATHRGLAPAMIRVAYDAASGMLAAAHDIHISEVAAAYAGYTRKPVSFKRAMGLLTEGKAVSVALNEKVCIEVNILDERGPFNILYKQARVGYITASGELCFFDVKMSSLSVFTKLFEKRDEYD